MTLAVREEVTAATGKVTCFCSDVATDNAGVWSLSPEPRRAALSRERRSSILKVAREIFVEEGFAASSMSAIAARLGGSKGTLYTYFSSKDALFAEVVAEECAGKIALMFGADLMLGPNIETGLRNFGKRFVRLIFSEETMQFTRMIIAESSRRPELGALFYEAGPSQSRRRLSLYLESFVATGCLPHVPVDMVAKQFCDLCLSELYVKRLMNIVPPPSDDQIEEIVDAAVSVIAAHLQLGFPSLR